MVHQSKAIQQTWASLFTWKMKKSCSGGIQTHDILLTSISFSMENEKELLRWDSNPRHTAYEHLFFHGKWKRAAQVGFKSTTYCLRASLFPWKMKKSCSGGIQTHDILLTSISFSMENEKELLRWDSNPRHTAYEHLFFHGKLKRAAHVGFKPTTYCLRASLFPWKMKKELLRWDSNPRHTAYEHLFFHGKWKKSCSGGIRTHDILLTSISFSMENEKRAAQVGFEPTTYCLRASLFPWKMKKELLRWDSNPRHTAYEHLFFHGKWKRAAHVGFKPTTYCLRASLFPWKMKKELLRWDSNPRHTAYEHLFFHGKWKKSCSGGIRTHDILLTSISFSMENEKRAAQVGFKPTTYCLRASLFPWKVKKELLRWDSNPRHTAYEADALPTELPRQLSWLGRIKGKGNQSNLTW